VELEGDERVFEGNDSLS